MFRTKTFYLAGTPIELVIDDSMPANCVALHTDTEAVVANIVTGEVRKVDVPPEWKNGRRY